MKIRIQHQCVYRNEMNRIEYWCIEYFKTVGKGVNCMLINKYCLSNENVHKVLIKIIFANFQLIVTFKYEFTICILLICCFVYFLRVQGTFNFWSEAIDKISTILSLHNVTHTWQEIIILKKNRFRINEVEFAEFYFQIDYIRIISFQELCFRCFTNRKSRWIFENTMKKKCMKWFKSSIQKDWRCI